MKKASRVNEAREFSERLIDEPYSKMDWKKKPGICREQAGKVYPAVAKRQWPDGTVWHRGIKQLLQPLRRSPGHIEWLPECRPEGAPIPSPRWILQVAG